MSARLDIAAGVPAVGLGKGGGRRTALALLLAALAVAALLALAAAAWRQQLRPAFVPGPLGATYAVQLQNGQMFYGVLRALDPAQLQLAEVYYVQPYTMPNGQPGNRVVSRQRNDWHGPTSLSIPLERVLYVEAVGPESQLARLIAQDKATPAVAGR